MPAVSHCRSASCKAEVRWVTTVRDRIIPLDAEPVAKSGEPVPAQLAGLFVLGADGKAAMAVPHLVELIVDGVRILTVPLYRSHFVSCPDRDAWRVKDKPAAKKSAGA
jgi:hypothetical protein